jgi:PAS domain S-box-containing protein
VLSTEEYRAVFESSPDGIVVVCRDGKIKDVNPMIEVLFGFAREELLDELVEMLVPEVFRGAHLEHRSRYMRNPHARPMGVGLELRGRRKDGSEFPMEISLSPWVTDLEGGLRVVCTVRDITDRKRLQDFSEGALRSVEEERQRISRELHDDTAQRLATLMLRVRLIGREPNPERVSTLLVELREEILDAAEGVKRIARGLRPPELEEVGLGLALASHARSLREGAGFEVDVDVEPVEHLLTLDAKLALYRIIQESLSNSVRHSGAGTARVLVRAEGEMVVATVEDDGRGFSSAKIADKGAGLGLVGMQERALMMGGRVTVDSTPGEGTRVRIEVPSSAVEARNV